MQATGIIMLLAAGVLVLFGQGGSFVPVHEAAEPDYEYKLIARDIFDKEV